MASKPLELKRRPLGRDILAYSMALALLFIALGDGHVEASESSAMLVLYVLYILTVIFSSRIREGYRVKYLGRAARAASSFVTQGQESLNPAAQDDSLALPAATQSPHTATPEVDLQPLPLADSAQAALGSEADHVPVLQAPSSSLQIQIAPGVAGGSRVGGGATPLLGSAWLLRVRGVTRRASAVALTPLYLALRVTCPECTHDSPRAHLYPVTLATSFTWVAVLSTIIAAIVSRWGEILGIPTAVLGMCVIAIGAEIPDTIQSVTVARRGYGSMAVSNSTGSQIINICIGLGLPWLITNIAGRSVPVPGVDTLRIIGGFQAANVAIYFSLLLLPTIQTWRPGDHSKAALSRRKGAILLATYVLVLLICAPILFHVAGSRAHSR